MARNDEDDGDVGLEDKIDVIAKKSLVHLLVSISFVPLMVMVFIAGLLGLAEAHKVTSTMDTKKPENRVEQFSKKIEDVKTKAAAQYQNYLVKMEDESIFAVSDKFRVLYQQSIESERDYVEFVESYQVMSYEMASRVRGSGEWYYYFEKKVAKFAIKAKRREVEMKKYLLHE